MGFFNFFLKKITTLNSSSKNEVDEFLPTEETSVDELFTVNFIESGGKFLYATTLEEIILNFEQILIENNWSLKNVLCYNNALSKQFNIESDNTDNPDFFLTTCEGLIANNGSILMSSNQIKEEKINTLPHNFIVFASASQLKETISDGLKTIKKNSTNYIPSNITTLKCFKIPEEKDSLTYGSNTKNLYLLLLEDL